MTVTVLYQSIYYHQMMNNQTIQAILVELQEIGQAYTQNTIQYSLSSQEIYFS